MSFLFLFFKFISYILFSGHCECFSCIVFTFPLRSNVHFFPRKSPICQNLREFKWQRGLTIKLTKNRTLIRTNRICSVYSERKYRFGCFSKKPQKSIWPGFQNPSRRSSALRTRKSEILHVPRIFYTFFPHESRLPQLQHDILLFPITFKRL